MQLPVHHAAVLIFADLHPGEVFTFARTEDNPPNHLVDPYFMRLHGRPDEAVRLGNGRVHQVPMGTAVTRWPDATLAPEGLEHARTSR